ncbi:putative reverse transcriptase domain-containing protein, partial [Tanacetum coccineum]
YEGKFPWVKIGFGTKVLNLLINGSWYYSLGVFLEIVDVFVRSEFEISSWRGAIDGSEANGIIRNPKLELESSRFTFDLVPLSYESVDVIVGENWLLRHKAEMVCHKKVVKMPWSCKVRVGSNGNLLWEASVLLGRKKGGVHGDDVAKTVFRMHNGHVEVYGYAFWVNQCTSDFHGVNEPDDRGVTEGREDVREVFQQRGSGAKRKLSRCRRNQMGNEPILALPEGADDFVVYYDVRSNDLEACLEKGRRLTNRWLSMKKDIASCGSKYLAYSEVEVEYQGSSGLLLQPELPE